MKIDNQITEDDILSIDYFVNTKGRLEDWVCWEERKNLFPELNALTVAKREIEASIREHVCSLKDKIEQ